MTKEEYNLFFLKEGPNVHSDPSRFNAISKLCQGSVLDVGCGSGDLSDFYKNKYTGVDISDVAIKQAKEIRRKDAVFEVIDILKNNLYLKNTFDTIVLAEFLEHIEKDEDLFQRLIKILSPKGRFIISVPNGDRVPAEDHKREFTTAGIRKKYQKYGKIKFHNFEEFKRRILFTIDVGKKNEDLISLVMIAKNEEKGIEKAILSCIDFIDNIVISVDNKSTDKTLKIVSMYADKLKRFNFQNDFAKARNDAQENIKTKWALIIDGHEYIDKCKDIDKFLKEDVDALNVKVRLENGFSYWYPRIIRSSAKWVKPAHNYPVVKTIKQYKNFRIQHDRQEGQNEESREERNKQREKMLSEILTKKLKEDKKDVRSAFYLAQNYQYSREFKKAIKLYKHYLKYAKNPQERWLVWYELGNAYNFLDKHKKAINFYKKAEKELPDRWEIAKKIGATYMFLRDWWNALNWLIESFKKNKTDFVYNPEPLNVSQTWFFISQCFFELKEYEKAKIALKRSKETQTEDKFGKLSEEQIKIIENIL